jgi:hypothetical protein
MSRTAIVTIGLSILGGTGLGTTVSGLGARPASADVILQPVSRGDTGGEKGEVEAPRGIDQITDGQSAPTPRWGDQGGEQGEVEARRA